MRIKVILISSVVVASVVVLPLLGLNAIFGARIEMRHSKMQRQKGKAPFGVVRVVGVESVRDTIPESIGIRAFNEIYASIGVTQQTFAKWETEHGMDSLGTDGKGQVLASGYPVLSKAAWMYIDPVTLTPAETADLIKECEAAIRNSADEATKHELEAIRSLAEKALSISAVVQFGHP